MEFDWIIEEINSNEFKNVALQIPHCMLEDARCYVERIQNALSDNFVKVQVLADSNYSECCVDESTAAHMLCCDCIVHFGHSCFSAPSIYQTLLVPPPNTTPLTQSHITSCIQFIASRVAPDDYNKIFISDKFHRELLDSFGVSASGDKKSNLSFGRVKRKMKPCCSSGDFGRHFEDNSSSGDLKAVLYFGEPDDRLLQLLCLKYFVSCSLFAFNPVTSSEIDCMPIIRRLSTKRSHLIERAKEAEIVGILVGTLSVSGYKDAVLFARKLIKSAGKKSYTFVVGKINVAKLANFAEIDAFVIIACGETALNDFSEFFKPVMSLCELNLALNPHASWDGSFDLDFAHVLKKHGHDQLDEPNSESSTSSAMMPRSDWSLLPKTASAFLNRRCWQGLEMKLGESEVALIEPGLSGIPLKYDKEN